MLEPLRRGVAIPRFKEGNSVAERYSILEKLWSPRNEIRPTEVSDRFTGSVLWVCEKGHESLSKIQNKILRPNCPVCDNRRLLVGYNDAMTAAPELLENWDYELNKISPKEVLPSGGTQYWWKCEKEPHSFLETFNNIRRGRKCPYCRGLRILEGFNDVASSPIVDEWDYSKNTENPRKISRGNHNNFHWVCPVGHEYEMSCDRRTGGRGCSYCAGKKVYPGESLADLRPEIASLWVKPIGGSHSPKTVSLGSNKRGLWKLECSHEIEASVKRMSGNYSCPYCLGDGHRSKSNRKLLKGFNDFATVAPEAAKYWDYDKNNSLPSDFVAGTKTKAHFVCDKGHESYSPIGNRAAGLGCPDCVHPKSKGELEVLEFLKSHGLDLVSGDRDILNGLELDIYCPSLNIAVEFNGCYWHSEAVRGKHEHLEKYKLCQDKGIFLIQVWEDDWLTKRPIVEKMLLSKFGKLEVEKVNARDTILKPVSYSEGSTFLEENHIQGAGRGRMLGLFHEGELVSVLSYKQFKSETQIVRFASSRNVRGGFQKLLKGLKNIVGAGVSITTFSDNEISSGELYEASGFVKVAVLAPDYKYLVNGIREHKFNYRKKRFRDDPDLLWEEGLSESELAGLNNFLKCWDSGKIKWCFDS